MAKPITRTPKLTRRQTEEFLNRVEADLRKPLRIPSYAELARRWKLLKQERVETEKIMARADACLSDYEAPADYSEPPLPVCQKHWDSLDDFYRGGLHYLDPDVPCAACMAEEFGRAIGGYR